MTPFEIRAELLALDRQKADLTGYDLMRLQSLAWAVAKRLEAERDRRDISSVDECLEIEGAPV